MSRNPLVFEVRALFLTGLKGWVDLFPQTFQNVLRILNDDLMQRQSSSTPHWASSM